MNRIRFTHLLDRHLEGVATPEEQLELTALLRMGDPDELGDHFQEIAKARMSIPGSRTQSVDEWLSRGSASVEAPDRVVHPAEVFPAHLSFLPRVSPTPVPAKQEPEDPTGGAFSLKGNGAAWLKVAAVAIVTLGVSFYYFRRSPETFEESTAALVQKPSYTTVSGETYFRLPDGSTVLLNAGSSLSYAESFGVDNRKVILDGEAYFDVVHDPKHTFTVHSGSVTTSVLGTAFNVKAYPGQNQVVVTVVHGKVRVSDEDRTFATITPNQQVIVDMTTHEAEQVIVNTTSELAWKQPYIILDNVPVPSALKLVSDKYHIPIRLESEELKGCRITSVFLDNVSLEDVLMIITRSFNANYTRKNGVVVIRGGMCNSGSDPL